MSEPWLFGGLALIMGMVLVLPFSVRWVEEELEAFLLVMGALAATVSGIWSLHLVGEALKEPLKISAAVLVFGFLFRWARDPLRAGVSGLARRMGMGFFLFALVAGVGLLSSVITAIIASLALVEVLSGLNLDKDKERKAAILGCYSIGLGAVLTPIGEPLSTIATARLAGEPHHAGFFFLASLLWPWITGGIFLCSLFALRFAGKEVAAAESLTEDEPETLRAIAVRAGKVYAFVAALVLLGHGFTPIVDRYLLSMPQGLLFWVNMVSAVLDNATLAAAEISPRMGVSQIEFILLGLLISGGMLIPGNIPNIICAKKLGISSREWGIFAAPFGLGLMALCFLLLQVAR